MHESAMGIIAAVFLFILLQGTVHVCNVCYFVVCVVIDCKILLHEIIITCDVI